MTVPVPRTSTYADSAVPELRGFVESLGLAQSGRGGMTLVYAPSTTNVISAAPVDVTLPSPAGTPATSAAMHTVPHRTRYTLGEVTAYSGATLMGGATLSGLVCSLLPVPMVVPLLSGLLALLGMLTAIGGAALDGRERNEATR